MGEKKEPVRVGSQRRIILPPSLLEEIGAKEGGYSSGECNKGEGGRGKILTRCPRSSAWESAICAASLFLFKRGAEVVTSPCKREVAGSNPAGGIGGVRRDTPGQNSHDCPLRHSLLLFLRFLLGVGSKRAKQ